MVMAALLIVQHSFVFSILSHMRALVYEKPLLLVTGILFYVIIGTLVSFKIRKVFPFFLSGFILFICVFNLFSSYQEVLKFGINQPVFTGLVSILLHSAALPFVLLSVKVDSSSFLGMLVLGLLFFKGFLIVKKWFNPSLIEKVLLSAAFGFGVTSFTTFSLAALQLLTFRNTLLMDLAFFSAIFLLPARRVELPETSIVLSPIEKKVWVFVGFILLGGLLYAVMFPPLEWDSLAYQAYYSKVVYENHGLPTIFGPSIGIEMSAAYPPAYQMLGCYLYVLTGELNAQLMSVLSHISGTLSLVVIFLFATLTIPSHRMYAVVAAVAVPFYLAFSASPHYQTLLIFFNSLFLLYLSRYVLEENVNSLRLSAVFLGFAILTSYLALASCLFLVLVYIKKRFSLKTAILTGALASPPLLRNLYFTGNPLFPLFGFGRQIQNLLWVSNATHFKMQAIYAGLDIRSPFSILDFLMNRISSIRPLLPLIMVTGLVFLIFVRPKKKETKWLTICYLASLFIFMVKPTFDRYPLIYVPVYSSFFAWMLYKSEGSYLLKRSLQFVLMASLSIVTLGILITGPLMVASHLKQFPEHPLDDWAYVRQFYPHDTPCWRWLNENTPSDKFVATYDIRYYYIDKKIFPLDGLEALPLYTMPYEEALQFLKEKNVSYIFSTRWTSPADETSPPAYYENPLIPHLGSDSLPLVYVSGQAAIYAVGKQRINYQHILETDNVLYPVHGYAYKLIPEKVIYFDIPGDLHGKMIVLQFSREVRALMYRGHAVSPSLLGERVEEAAGDTLMILFAHSGKYTLYIESEEPFTVKVLII